MFFKRSDQLKWQLHLALIIWDLVFYIFSLLNSPSSILHGINFWKYMEINDNIYMVRDTSLGKL